MQSCKFLTAKWVESCFKVCSWLLFPVLKDLPVFNWSNESFQAFVREYFNFFFKLQFRQTNKHNSGFMLTIRWPGKRKGAEIIENYYHNTNLTLISQVMKILISKPIFTISQNKISKAFFIVSPASVHEYKWLI